MYETLENRKMFSVTADAFHETLYVWGDANNNGISVEKSGANLVVKQYVGGQGYQQLFSASDAYVKQVRVYGYAGADTISIADNVTDPATVYGGKGGDWIKGGGGQSDLWGHGDWAGNADHSQASDDGAADTIVSGKGYATHHGQKGDDTLITDENAASGYDVMMGGDGNDRFYVNGHGNTAYAFGEAGADSFVAKQSSTQTAVFNGGAGWDRADYTAWTAAVYVRPDGATLSGALAGDRHQYIGSDVEFVEGTSKADLFSGTAADNTFYGHGGDDTMYGNGGADTLAGMDGNDKLFGGAGNDILIGGAGNDTLSGGDGDDSAYGGVGNDDIHGGAGNDKLYGQGDADWIYGDAGGDLLVGGSGADYLVTHDGVLANDLVRGDNEDGSGAAGFLDVAYVDKGKLFGDITIGVESVTS